MHLSINTSVLLTHPITIATLLLISISSKTRLTYVLLKSLVNFTNRAQHTLLLPTAIFCNLAMDVVYLVKLARLHLTIIAIPIEVSLFCVHISWIIFVIQYLSLGIFIERFADKTQKLRWWHRLNIVICTAFCLVFLYYTIFKYNIVHNSARLEEFDTLGLATLYLYFSLLVNLFITLYHLNSKIDLPKVLQRQLRFFILAFILPYLLFELLTFNPIWLLFEKVFPADDFSLATYKSILFSTIMYFGTRYLLRIRFLNIQKEIKSKRKHSILDDFNTALLQLAQAHDRQELIHQTKSFFREHFQIPLGRTNLFFRDNHSIALHSSHDEALTIQAETELLLGSGDKQIIEYLQKKRIIVKDEIEFDLYYEQRPIETRLLQFMQRLQANLFITIFHGNELLGYILIEQDNRNNDFYANFERDQMVAFATFVGTTLNLMHSREITPLKQREKQLTQELHHKHREIAQYKESIHSFLKRNDRRHIGVLMYKNRQFIYLNQYAQEQISLNLNTQQGHPLSKELTKLSRRALEFRTEQIIKVTDPKGELLVACAIPSLEGNYVLVLMYRPEVTDMLHEQLRLLKDPSELDYLLYLETTESGKLVNQMIPGNTESFLHFKIALLKLALSKKAALLQLPSDDIIPTVELIHHVSLREHLHLLKLHQNNDSEELRIKLFGINPLLANRQEKPLFEKLDRGTLFIENIHLLDLATQKMLASLIELGQFQMYKSSITIRSDVRILCSSTQNLNDLVMEGLFDKDLYAQLQQEVLTLPSLLTLSPHELNEFVQNIARSQIKDEEFKHILAISDKEAQKIITKKPASITDFKQTVQQVLSSKTIRDVTKETYFDSNLQVSDPKLIEAARLGKHALKDPKIMALLWNKFKNQNKIATFLGVNRSSINRRCKEYNLV